MTLAPGTRLGPYEIVGPLGAGGMGEVFRARDPRLGRDVAIKVLPVAFAADAERLARFRREAQALAALNHPNVAAIYGLEDGTASPCLVLELVEGESLAARLARGALPLRDALALGVQVAAAIEAAHERGIVHRDLKPGNIMVSESGVAKVLDFGLAKSEAGAALAGDSSADAPTRTVAAAPTEAGVILGTAAYMSPEQARGRAVDRRGDVWSFGCVLFECLAGRPPFAGETVTDLLAKILEREPDWNALPAGTPARVREIVRRCLRKDADERPRDIRDVRLELAELAAGGARPAAAAESRSIAVLPFENQSGPDDEYFADGVTDEILNALAQVRGLRVAARSSCFAFKGRREDPRAVGERLAVAAVLEGTVRRAGQRLRVTAQLVSVGDGMQLWSERYDRELTDVFAVQDEIAAAIARRLSVSLGEGGARRGTQNLEAYELFLKGRAFQLRRGRFLANAIECFEAAIALDPDYAEAMAWLADSWRLLGTFGVAPAREMYPKARALAERALAIDPGLAEAWATIADAELQYEWNAERAEAAWRRALALDPRHTRARCERALWAFAYGSMGMAESLRESEAALSDDPDNSWALGMHSFVLGYAGRHEESIDYAARATERDSESVFALWSRVRAFAWAGRHEEARAFATSALPASGRHAWMLGALAWVCGKLGDVERANAIFDELAARARHELVSPCKVAMAAAAGNRPAEAQEWLRRAVADRDSMVVMMREMPYFDGLRTLPGFAEAAREVWP